MVDPNILRAMLLAGCTAEQIVSVAEDAARSAEEKAAEKREKDRLRKRAEREEKKNSQNNDGVQDVQRTTRTNKDNSDNPSSFEVSPHTPLPKTSNPIPPSPPKGGSSPTDFSQFWSLFPNRVGKGAAEKAFASALKRTPLEAILLGVERYAAKTDDRPWCNPATWLNQDRWLDQPAASSPQRQATAPPRKPNAFDAYQQIANERGWNEPEILPSNHGNVERLPAEQRGPSGTVVDLRSGTDWRR